LEYARIVEHSSIAKDIVLLVVGLAFGLLLWLLDKGRVEIPRYIVVPGVIAALIVFMWGLANLASLACPEAWRSKSISIVNVAFLSLALVALSWWIFRAVGVHEEVGRVKTELRLRFSGKYERPEGIHADNIENWYTLWNERQEVSFFGEGNKQIGGLVSSGGWTIFVSFQKPTTYRELSVSFSDPGFPQWEVKLQTPRYVIISVSGPIPSGNLEIYAKQ